MSTEPGITDQIARIDRNEWLLESELKKSRTEHEALRVFEERVRRATDWLGGAMAGFPEQPEPLEERPLRIKSAEERSIGCVQDRDGVAAPSNRTVCGLEAGTTRS